MYHRFIIEQVIGFLYDRDDRKTAAWDFRGQDTVTKPLQVPQSAPRRARPNRPAKSFDGRKKIVRFSNFTFDDDFTSEYISSNLLHIDHN